MGGNCGLDVPNRAARKNGDVGRIPESGRFSTKSSFASEVPIDHLHYLAALALCALGTVPLEWLGRGVYRRAGRVVKVMVLPLAVFLLWDAVAIRRGHWWFDEGQVVGWRLGGVPIEEVLFFVVIPVCALLTLEAVRGLLGRRHRTTAGRADRWETSDA